MTTGPNEASEGPARDPVAGKTVAEILGEIVWLMTQDPTGREMKVADIERLVMPAILQRRFHIRYARIRSMMRSGEGTLQPVSVDIYDLRTQTGLVGQTEAGVTRFTLPSSKNS